VSAARIEGEVSPPVPDSLGTPLADQVRRNALSKARNCYTSGVIGAGRCAPYLLGRFFIPREKTRRSGGFAAPCTPLERTPTRLYSGPTYGKCRLRCLYST
jgi:hypothetical protein